MTQTKCDIVSNTHQRDSCNILFLHISEICATFNINKHYNHQSPDFDDMSSFLPCKIDDVIQYINLEYEAQAKKIVILMCIFS